MRSDYRKELDMARTKSKGVIKAKKTIKEKERGVLKSSNYQTAFHGNNLEAYDEQRYPHITYVLCKEKGFTETELAKVFGVTKNTIVKWKSNFPDFKNAMICGRDEFDQEFVEKALLKRALGFEYKERIVKQVHVKGVNKFTGIDFKVPAEEITIIEKFVAPETKAAIYWLSNRNPERWQQAVKVQADITNKTTTTELSVSGDLEHLNEEQLLALRSILEVNQTAIPLASRQIYDDVQDAILVEADKIDLDYDIQ
jgi:transcriptional regulator with XRE-family HTH domain